MATKKAIQIDLKIGNINLSNKSVKKLDIDRNFSDTSNSFTIELIDSPEVSTTDLELYMAGGFRNITFSYADRPESKKFIKFSGTIWDYQCAFSGNMKILTITGYVSRSYSSDISGEALYNIDWNNYYNLRVDPTKFWNVLEQVAFNNKRARAWAETNNKKSGENVAPLASNVTFEGFSALYNYNSVFVSVKGPSGTIHLPVPDSFTSMAVGETKVGSISTKGDNVDEKGKFWGELKAYSWNLDSNGNEVEATLDEKTKVPTETCYWKEKKNNAIRAFCLPDDTSGKFYIQSNPNKSYYGAGSFIYNPLGTDISYIVRQLAILEGWDVDYIVQTEMVPCSDSFKMKNQTALQFINENLIPLAVVPSGTYKTKNGKTTKVDTTSGGFVAYFTSSGKFRFEPLNSSTIKLASTELTLGYNYPKSPVLSFQVETKGTCFYTTNSTKINSMFITTGKEVDTVTTSTESQLANYNKVSGHNENLDAFFGYTYDDIQKLTKGDSSSVKAGNVSGLWSGFSMDSGTKAVIYNYNKAKGTWEASSSEIQDKLSNMLGDNGSSIGAVCGVGTSIISNSLANVSLSSKLAEADQRVIISSSAYQKKLVNKLTSSAQNSSVSVSAALNNAYAKIKSFIITASMNLWGDINISPASIISVTNMVKKANSHSIQKHPTSGDYLVLKQTDSVSGSEFIQKLSLIRNTADLAEVYNNQNIDWSKGIDMYKLSENYTKVTPIYACDQYGNDLSKNATKVESNGKVTNETSYAYNEKETKKMPLMPLNYNYILSLTDEQSKSQFGVSANKMKNKYNKYFGALAKDKAYEITRYKYATVKTSSYSVDNAREETYRYQMEVYNEFTRIKRVVTYNKEKKIISDESFKNYDGELNSYSDNYYQPGGQPTFKK